MKDELNPYVKLDVALEILAAKIGMTFNDNGSEEEMRALMKERDLFYQGDKEIIDKIFNVYAPEVKARYEKAGEKVNKGYSKK